MKKYIFIFALWSLLFTLFYGCQPIPMDPKDYPAYDPEPNVFCVIGAGLDVQTALVGKTYRMSDTIPVDTMWEWAGVSGAQVTITGAGDTIKLNETDSAGIYRSEGDIKAGTPYYLEVIYPDNKKVKGETKTPAEFKLLKPQHSDTVTEDDTLFWNKNIDSYLYYVWVTILADTSISFGRSVWSDTFITFNNFGELFELSDTLILKVGAYDKHYYYYSRWGMEDYTNLEGGLGVFGSITITDSILVFIK